LTGNRNVHAAHPGSACRAGWLAALLLFCVSLATLAAVGGNDMAAAGALYDVSATDLDVDCDDGTGDSPDAIADGNAPFPSPALASNTLAPGRLSPAGRNGRVRPPSRAPPAALS